MEWLGDRHGGNLGADLLGEEDALLDGLGGELRPIGRDQDVLVQYVSPPGVFLSAEKIGEIDLTSSLPSMIEATIGIDVSSDIRRVPRRRTPLSCFWMSMATSPPATVALWAAEAIGRPSQRRN
jgi:hypothetical protein